MQFTFGDCVMCLWFTSDFTYDSDGQFPRAHPYLCYFPSTKRATALGLQAGYGGAGQGHYYTEATLNRTLKPHECSSLLSSIGRFQKAYHVHVLLRGPTYISDLEHSPIMLTCPPSLTLLTLSLLPPRTTSQINYINSISCFSLCFGRTQTKIRYLPTLPILHLPQGLPLSNHSSLYMPKALKGNIQGIQSLYTGF